MRGFFYCQDVAFEGAKEILRSRIKFDNRCHKAILKTIKVSRRGGERYVFFQELGDLWFFPSEPAYTNSKFHLQG